MPSRKDPLKALEYELRHEQAISIGRAGRNVELALAALANAARDQARTEHDLVDEAANAVWQYFVQLEASGVHHHDKAIEAYAIPQRVLARLGASKRPPAECGR